MAISNTAWFDSVQRPVKLTKREIEVLSLIAQGNSSKEAVDAL